MIDMEALENRIKLLEKSMAAFHGFFTAVMELLEQKGLIDGADIGKILVEKGMVHFINFDPNDKKEH